MPKKSHKKKIAYQTHCRAQVKDGRFNDEKGDWRPESGLNKAHTNMFRDMRAGYKL